MHIEEYWLGFAVALFSSALICEGWRGMFVWFVRILISTVTQCKGFVAYIMTTKYLLFVSQDFELDCST